MRSKESIFVLGAGDLDREGAAGDVDDVRVEDLCELHDLAAALDRRVHAEERHLASHGPVGLHVADLDHVDELVELLGDLVDRVDGAVERERHARDVRVLGGADRQRVDVEAAAAEQAGDAREDAGLVLDQEGEDVLAPRKRARGLEVLEFDQLRCARLAHQPTMSRAAAPAGIIG